MDEIVARQEGVASRRQLRAMGISDRVIQRRVRNGRWRSLGPGVYATFSGPVSPKAMVWAVVLQAGTGAAAGPRTTLWLVKATDHPPPRWDVVVPSGRHVCDGASFRVHRRRYLDRAVHPASCPPRLRAEEALLDACDDMDRAEAVVDLVVRVVQRRLTTPDRIAAHLAARSRHRWRALLSEVLADVRHGVRSVLELRWLHDVERAHGLPASALNQREELPTGRVYRDVLFEEFGVLVETDGQEAHPAGEAFRDRQRDNRSVVQGYTTLRYGWREIAGDPCGVAAEVASVLRLHGWTGRLKRCGLHCKAVP